MNAHVPLSIAVSMWDRMKTQLVHEYGLDPDDPVLTDTLDGETDLGDRIVTMLREALENERFAKALDDFIEEKHHRRERLLARAKAIRKTVAWAAAEAGLPKLTRCDMTVSFTKPKPVLAGTADPTELPDDLVRIKREINRTAVRAAVEAGRDVPGFRLTNGEPGVRVSVD